MTQILLARHGETGSSARGIFVGGCDISLNDTGIEQARALAVALGDHGLVRVYTSSLRRARQTADIIGAIIGRTPIVDSRLVETDMGRWEAVAKTEIKKAEPVLYRARGRNPESFRFPGGESLAEHQRRVALALRDIADGPGPALVICHHGSIRCALTLGHPEGLAAWRQFKVPNATAIALPAACLAQCR